MNEQLNSAKQNSKSRQNDKYQIEAQFHGVVRTPFQMGESQHGRDRLTT